MSLELKTALMFPFAEFGKQWNESNQLKLTNITQQVDFFANSNPRSLHKILPKQADIKPFNLNL